MKFKLKRSNLLNIIVCEVCLSFVLSKSHYNLGGFAFLTIPIKSYISKIVQLHLRIVEREKCTNEIDISNFQKFQAYKFDGN